MGAIMSGDLFDQLPEEQPKIQLRPYQERAIAGLRSELARLKAAGLPMRVILQAPCGFGKTICSSAIMKSALDRGHDCMFIASGRLLVQQKSATLERCGIHHTVLMDGYDFGLSRCVVVSKDTYWSRAFESEKVPRLNTHLIIIDEARSSISPEWQRLLLAHPNVPVVGLDATPARGNGRGLGTSFWQSIVPASRFGASYQ